MTSCEVGSRVVYCSDHKLAGVVKFVGLTNFSEGLPVRLFLGQSQENGWGLLWTKPWARTMAQPLVPRSSGL